MEPVDDHTTNSGGGTQSLNDPHAITHKEWMRLWPWYLFMRGRVVPPKLQEPSPSEILERGVAGFGEMLNFQRHDPLMHQSDTYRCMVMVFSALIDLQDGVRDPLLFDQPTKRGNKERSLVNSLRAIVAHAVAVLRAGKTEHGAFTPKDAADTVAQQLEKGGFRVNVPRMKSGFINWKLAQQWHAAVTGEYANAEACNMAKKLWRDFAAWYPEHEQWPREKRLEWLAGYVSDLGRVRKSLAGPYFGRRVAG